MESLSQYISSLVSKDKPLSAIEFIESSVGFNTKLWPSQRFIMKLLEGEVLDKKQKDIQVSDKFNEKVLYTFSEFEYFNFLRKEGRISVDYTDYLENTFTQLLLAMGRRASKTTMISLWVGAKLYHLLNIYHPQDFFKILDKDIIGVTMVALGEDSAADLFQKLSNLIQNSKFFANHLREEPTKKELFLWTNYDIDNLSNTGKKTKKQTASIKVSAHANSPSVRGANNVFTIMEEIAHFNYGKAVKTDKPLDKVIYDALSPSIVDFNYPDGRPFGKNFLVSSPEGQEGLFYDEHENAFTYGVESGCLAIRAPTWYFNTRIHPSILKKEHLKSPTTYEKEYGAEFTVGSGIWIEDVPKFYKLFDKSLIQCPPDYNKKYFLGLDFGLEEDGLAMALCHIEPDYLWYRENVVDKAFTLNEDLDEEFGENEFIKLKDILVVDYLKYYKAGEEELANELIVNFFEVLDDLVILFRDYPIVSAIYDQWSSGVISQNIKKKNLDRVYQVKFDTFSNCEVAQTFIKLMLEEKLKMLWTQKLEDEFLNLIAVRVGKFYKIQAKTGYNDDRYDAISRAVYLTYAYLNKLERFRELNLKAIFQKGMTSISSERLGRAFKQPSLGPPGLAKRSLEALNPRNRMRQEMRRSMRFVR